MSMRGGAAPRLVMKTPIVEMDGDEMTRIGERLAQKVGTRLALR